MQINEAQLQSIVEQVLKNIQQKQNVQEKKNPVQAESQSASSSLLVGEGVFQDMGQAIEASAAAFKELQTKSKEDRKVYIEVIRKTALEHAKTLSEMILEETKMGNVKDKIMKHEGVAKLTPGVEDLESTVWTGDQGTTIVEHAPYGVIGAITPSTNPTETIVNNSISMIAGGNTVVFNTHPGAKHVSAYAVQLLNKAIAKVGGPKNLITAVANPTLDSANVMMKHPEVKLLVGTGGPGMVRALLQSGKRAIGAGAGNPPVIVDETANLKKAAKDILDGATFDNNLLCIAEKEVIVLEAAADELIYHFLQSGGYLASKEQIKALEKLILTEKEELKSAGCSIAESKKEYAPNKKWIGKDVEKFLEALGIPNKGYRCILCEVDADHPFVVEELMMPVLPIVRTKSFEEAVQIAVKAEKGNKHSAHIHSTNIERITAFARAINTTVFVTNAPSYACVGIGGEGYSTFSIAGSTGEGLTSAKTFTRQRRFTISGALNIV